MFLSDAPAARAPVFSSMCASVTLDSALQFESFVFVLSFSDLRNTTYQSDMIIYGPLDPRLHHTPDPYIQLFITLISAPLGREKKKNGRQRKKKKLLHSKNG